MTSNVIPGRPDGTSLRVLHAAGLISLLVGAVGSVGFMLYAGRRNPSRILLILFTGWVLSPFMALLWANMISKHWSVITRATLYSLMLVITLGSLVIYGEAALRPHRGKAAFPFVIVAPASWLLSALVVPMAARISGRLARRDDAI